MQPKLVLYDIYKCTYLGSLLEILTKNPYNRFVPTVFLWYKSSMTQKKASWRCSFLKKSYTKSLHYWKWKVRHSSIDLEIYCYCSLRANGGIKVHLNWILFPAFLSSRWSKCTIYHPSAFVVHIKIVSMIYVRGFVMIFIESSVYYCNCMWTKRQVWRVSSSASKIPFEMCSRILLHKVIKVPTEIWHIFSEEMKKL